MATRLIEEPLPFRGLNSGPSPVNLPPGYSPEMHDMVTGTPGELRPRRGWRREVGSDWDGLSATLGQDKPIGYMRDWQDPRRRIIYSMILDGTRSAFTPASGGVEMTTDATVRAMMPKGHPTWFVDRDYSTSHDSFTRFFRISSTGTGTGKSVVVFGGNTSSGNATAGLQTRTVSVSNGGRNVTLSSGFTGSSNGHGLFMVISDTTAGETAGHKYLYEIDSDATAGTSAWITENYGLGDSAALVPNVASKTATFYPIGYLPNSPDADDVTSWRDRLWTIGRIRDVPPTKPGNFEIGNILAWSAPADPNRWPVSNFQIVDATSPLTAVASSADFLLVFEYDRTWIMTGYDESNFRFELLFANIGCLGPGGVVLHNNQVFWMGPRGVYAFDGNTFDTLTQWDDGSVYFDYQSMVRPEVSGVPTSDVANDIPFINVHNDLVLCSMDRDRPAADSTYVRPVPMVCHLPTKTWSTWGKLTGEGHNPGMFVKLAYDADTNETVEDHLWGVNAFGHVWLDQVWDHESLGLRAGVTPNTYMDEIYSGGAWTISGVEARFATRDFYVVPGQTVRIQDVMVNHGCMTDAASNQITWTVTLDTDQDIDAATLAIGDVLSRVYGSGTVPRGKIYTDNFTGLNFPTEGMVFRVRFVANFTASTDINNAKLYAVRFNMLDAPTKLGRVDNT